ncbi:MAG: cellulose synthase [Egibacteraceae bacterium]
MPDYNQIAWLPLSAGLTGLGLLASWLVWRRRGAAAGLRTVAWSLIPLAAYLIGLVALLWQVGVAVVSFGVRFVLSPVVWAGVALTGIAAVLFVTAAVLRRRGVGGKRAVSAAPAQAADDDMAEIEALLRQRGIK